MEAKVIKCLKKFYYEGVELKIVKQVEPYMNSPEGVTMTRAISPNGKQFPICINKCDTLKIIQTKVLNCIESAEKHGIDVLKAMTE